MTAIDRASAFVQTAEFASHVSSSFKRCWNALQGRRRSARLRAILRGMEDRELKDIGIARGEIEYLVLNGSDVTDRDGRYRGY